MHPNGTATTDRTVEPADSPRTSERVKELSPMARAVLADFKYIREERERGAWHPYAGHYIAVVDCTFRGHDVSAIKLRERVTTELGIPPNRVAISYIECPEDFFA